MFPRVSSSAANEWSVLTRSSQQNFISAVPPSPSSFQPPLLLCFSSSSSSPSEERLRGELGLWILKREAGGGPGVLREHGLSLSDLICESAGCFLHPRVVLTEAEVWLLLLDLILLLSYFCSCFYKKKKKKVWTVLPDEHESLPVHELNSLILLFVMNVICWSLTDYKAEERDGK